MVALARVWAGGEVEQPVPISQLSWETRKSLNMGKKSPSFLAPKEVLRLV